MSVETLSSHPLHVISTRVYESGPASPVLKPKQLSVSKQEELTTSRKKQQLITKQIETHVKREIVVDQDGNIVDAGDPNISTNTTEDVKVDETESNELKTTGGESPGPGWVIVPESKTVNEKVHRTKTNHVIRDEKTEAEETEGVPPLTRQEFQRAVDARRRNLALNGGRYAVQSAPLPVTETMVETEEVREVSEALGDVLYSTDKSRTSSREKSSLPFSANVETGRLNNGRRNASQRPQHSPPSPPSPTTVPIVRSPVSPTPPKIVPVATKNPVTVVNDPARRKDTSRWIQSHFGETPTRVTTVLRDAPSPVHVSEDNPHLGTHDSASSPHNFSAIKDFFQTAVAKTENYYTGRSNTMSQRDRGSRPGSSSGSYERVSNSVTKCPQTTTNGDQYQVQVVTVDHPGKWTENGARTLQEQHSREDGSGARRNFATHDTFSADKTSQGFNKEKNFNGNNDQELNVQRIINSIRSATVKDSRRPNCQSPTMTSSRLSPEGKHVIKININSGKPSIHGATSPEQNYHFVYDLYERPGSAASYLNGSSPSQKIKMKLNNSSNLKTQKSLNRSTPTLHQSSSSPPVWPEEVWAGGRSLSSLALNQPSYNGSTNTHSLPRKNRGKSSVWISNDMEARRQRFMQDLLDGRDHHSARRVNSNPLADKPSPATEAFPKPPPRRHKSNNGHEFTPKPTATLTRSLSPPLPSLRRPTSPDSRSFYYLGEEEHGQMPPRSESPVTRTEKTVKRTVTTSKTCTKDGNRHAKLPFSKQSSRARV